MKLKNLNILLLAFSFFYVSSLIAVVAGSSQSVSVQSFTTFPAADLDNEMKDFGWFKNGFALENALTTCIFNSIYPVSGVISFNDGTIILNQDLILRDFVNFESFGRIIGNGRNFDLKDARISVPTGLTAVYENVNIIINSDFVVSSTYVFRGECTITGDENGFMFVDDIGSVVVDSNAHLVFKNINIMGLGKSNIRCLDDSARITFHNVNITQESDFEFSKVSILFENQVSWGGTFTFTYDSSQSSTIAPDSKLIMNNNTFIMGRYSDSALIEPLIFSERESILNLVNSTLMVSEHGARITKGTLQFTNNADILSSSTLQAEALVIGNGSSVDDMLFIFDGGASANFKKGLVVLDVVDVELFQSRSSGATILRGNESIFQINNDQLLSNITTINQPGAITNIMPGKKVLLENITVQTPVGSYVITGQNINPAQNLIDGNQSINLLSGVLPLSTLVANSGNFFLGSGILGAPIILQDDSAQLTIGFNGQLSADIILNGGRLDLINQVNFGNSFKMTGSGIIGLNDHILSLGYVDYIQYEGLPFVDPISWEGGQGVILLNSDLQLTSTWTFNGICRLIGNGSRLSLAPGGSLVINPGSALILHDINVFNISGDNIRCADDSAAVVLNAMSWNQDSNFTFSHGALIVQAGVEFGGNSLFAYQSSQPFVIAGNSSLTIDTQFTFSYDAPSPDLLQFTNRSSQIILNGGRLYATSQGLNLKVGAMIVNSTGGTFASEINGITLGDCFTSTNDFVCNISGGAQFEVSQGTLNYKNVDLSSWTMFNTFSTMKIASMMTLNLYQSLDLGAGLCIFGDNSFLGRAPGKDIFGSITEEGTLNFVDLPSC